MSMCVEQRISGLLFCLAGAMTPEAVYCYFMPPLGSALHVPETDFELSDASPGQKREIVFRLDNRSGKPIRILGQVDC